MRPSPPSSPDPASPSAPDPTRAHSDAPNTAPGAPNTAPGAPNTAPAAPNAAPGAPNAAPAPPNAAPDAVTATPAAPDVIRDAVRTWLRYLLPLTALSAIALSPLLLLALQIRVPRDLAGAQRAIGVGHAMVWTAWICQLVLVGAAAALTGPRRSQLAACGAGLVGLLRAIVPCAVATAAILLGLVTFAVPGLVLLVLLALTGASAARGLPAALRDSIAAARTQLPAIAITVAALLAMNAVIGLCAYRAFAVPLAKPPTPAQLAAIPIFVRAIAVGLVIAAPLPATILATLHRRATPPTGA